MLKNYLLLFTLFVVTSALSQTYTFDYMLEYQYTDFNDTLTDQPKTYTSYRFINSTHNDNTLMVWEAKDSTNIELLYNSGKYFYGVLPTEDFFVEAISMKCPYSGFIEPLILRTKDFEVLNKADTIINTEPFKHYIFNPVNKKKYQKSEIGVNHCIIDNTLGLNTSMLIPETLAYKFRKEGVKLPNGVLRESYVISHSGKIMFRQKLVQILPIKKVIIIDKNCK